MIEDFVKTHNPKETDGMGRALLDQINCRVASHWLLEGKVLNRGNQPRMLATRSIVIEVWGNADRAKNLKWRGKIIGIIIR